MSNYKSTDIAIIGISGKFPGSKNLDEFWGNIIEGKESVSFFTTEELSNESISKELLDSDSYVKANAYLKDKHYFDSGFFNYLPKEARLMDPQMRLFHQVCWHALEDSGYGRRKADDKIGLFAGAALNNDWMNYSQLLTSEGADAFEASQGSNISFLCSRVSYALDLQGPSVYLNTACSTSLVAVQEASSSLLLRECDIALAGGVRVNNFSKKGYPYREGMIYSRDGHCRPFDAGASGTVSGEGAGVVVLKRLKDALADKDTIHAIIRGSGLNNDGSRKMSFSAPSIDGQIKAVTRALKMSKIPAESVGYLEAHGTGTVLGDPIEVEALNRSYGRS
ncbi:beta-ketoacyl synthase N-terminal-like domain-containing protein, partial [Maribacter sp. 2307UL18-2]|uniref:beta-ketoacyl synthase N-terminal-like domain-containing protein n=1 Tax=Maribacter sp. 2307UL18-2 TaxID=3386274 RepID=UPI0039BC89CE